MVDVAVAGTGRASNSQSHADLPKHAFGSCSICTRRLLSSNQAAPVVRRSPSSAQQLPTRYLVQTSPVVPDLRDRRGR
jgi:hypothetical protein